MATAPRRPESDGPEGAYAAVVLFDVQVSDVHAVMVARVVGDVDLATLPQLQTALERLDGPEVAIDLRSVDWIDPICLGVLLAAALRARRRDGTLTVVAVDAVAELLAEIGLDRLITVVGELSSN
jgi:anti-sigma B factor antagonist